MKNKYIYIAIPVLLVVSFIVYSAIRKRKGQKSLGDSIFKKPDTGGISGGIQVVNKTGQKFTRGTDSGSIRASLNSVQAKYGKDIAQWVEKIYRLETNHFKSGQFKKTGSAGMIAASKIYPYGWLTPKKLWDSNPRMAPIGSVKMKENQGVVEEFLIFPTVEAAMLSLAIYISKYGNPARWYSTDPNKQAKYLSDLKKFPNHIIV